MKEAALEKKMRLHVEALGGQFLKLALRRGIQDRLVVLPGVIGFCEVKKPNERYRKQPLQDRWQARVEALGHPTIMVNSFEEFVAWVDSLM